MVILQFVAWGCTRFGYQVEGFSSELWMHSSADPCSVI